MHELGPDDGYGNAPKVTDSTGEKMNLNWNKWNDFDLNGTVADRGPTGSHVRGTNSSILLPFE